MRYYTLDGSGNVVGPWEEQQVFEWWSKYGTVSDDSPICREGEQNWMPFKSVLPEITSRNATREFSLGPPAPLTNSHDDVRPAPPTTTRRHREPSSLEHENAQTPFTPKLAELLDSLKAVRSRIETNWQSKGGYCLRCGKDVSVYSGLYQRPSSGGIVISNNAGMALYRPFNNAEISLFCRECGNKISFSKFDEEQRLQGRLRLLESQHKQLCNREKTWRSLARLSANHPVLATCFRVILGLPGLGEQAIERAIVEAQPRAKQAKVKKEAAWSGIQVAFVVFCIGLLLSGGSLRMLLDGLGNVDSTSVSLGTVGIVFGGSALILGFWGMASGWRDLSKAGRVNEF